MENTTTSSAHTPGPWHVEKHPSGSFDVCDGEASIASLNYVEGDESANSLEANAHLIAKAWLIPELLEALEYLLQQTVDMDLAHGIGLTEGEKDARKKALKVFAKATGNQP